MNKIFLITQREYRFHLSQRLVLADDRSIAVIIRRRLTFFQNKRSETPNKEI